MIKLLVSSNLEEQMKKFRASREAMKPAVFDAVLWGLLKIQQTARGTYILNKGSKTSAKSTRLHSRTGRLRGSIHYVGPSQVSSSAVEGKVGTNVVYGAHWELGFKGNIAIPAHKRTITQAFGRKLDSPVEVEVRPYTMKRDDDPRPFLGPARDDNARPIMEKIYAAISKSFSEAKT